jgi:phosphatidate cytidylyltransferase
MKRLLTALALIAFAVYLIFLAPDPVFMAGALLMGLLCYYEFSGLVAHYRIQKPGMLGLVAGLLILFQPQYTLIGLTVVLVIALALSLRRGDLGGILPYVACAFFGAFYTFAPWRFAADLRGFHRQGVHLLFFAIALNWIGDTAAYYVGRRFGRHKLAPVVSPKKSWEGAAASVAASVVFGLLYLGKLMPQIPWWNVTVMAVIGNIAGQFGDLAESALKRGAGVKDSGNMLPGHGGMLDRADSTLFALPVIYAMYVFTRQIRQ